MDLGSIANGTEDGLSGPDSQDNINISDVIDVIHRIENTEPEFSEQNMYSGGGELPGGATAPSTGASLSQHQLRKTAYVVIREQPASKSLRFRYECEGRSAGSIPGENSTPENKTFPTIQVMGCQGYSGKAFVVVSCVTKDQPYRAHPHNLVGREGCKKGVCTMQINTDNMTVTFSNLGIQCVKKKDIEEALKVREQIKVDPFLNGFSHRSQPSNIDLNAVRLCFQVFLEDKAGSFTPLKAVVSNPIYDKKAMSDLVICTMSDCTASVAGGQRIILLCEKVAKEDIQVRLFEERDGQLIWEGLADFQHTDVHKQVAITFRTPKYRTLQVDRPVHAQIQLRRPSDSATSAPLKFQLLPLDSGRSAFWSTNTSVPHRLDALRRLMTPSANAKLTNGHTEPKDDDVVIISEDVVDNDQQNKTTKPKETQPIPEPDNRDKSLQELLEQVAELDEIYLDSQTRQVVLQNDIETKTNEPETNTSPMDVDFDDSATYTSLQMAFKNPLTLSLPPQDLPVTTLEELMATPVVTPIIHISAPPIGPKPPVPPKKSSPVLNGKRENGGEEKLPPLPPKRVKKTPGTPDAKLKLGDSKPVAVEEPVLSQQINSVSTPSLPQSRPQSQIILIDSSPDDSQNVDAQTLPRPKKRNFLRKLFSKKPKNKGDKSYSSPASREPSLGEATPVGAGSVHSLRMTSDTAAPAKKPAKFSKKGKPVGRSVSSVSGKRPDFRDGPDMIHIPLKGDTNGGGSTHSLNTAPKFKDTLAPAEFGSIGLVKIDAGSVKQLYGEQILNDLDQHLDITEAEHYALYTDLAPHATTSEFDETSCFYAPIGGGKLITFGGSANNVTAINIVD